jgi:hypothetical protein
MPLKAPAGMPPGWGFLWAVVFLRGGFCAARPPLPDRQTSLVRATSPPALPGLLGRLTASGFAGHCQRGRRLPTELCVNSHNLPGRNIVSFRRCK